MLWWRVNAWNVNFKTLYSGQFTLSTQLIILIKITLMYSPTDAAPQFLRNLLLLFFFTKPTFYLKYTFTFFSSALNNDMYRQLLGLYNIHCAYSVSKQNKRSNLTQVLLFMNRVGICLKDLSLSLLSQLVTCFSFFYPLM